MIDINELSGGIAQQIGEKAGVFASAEGVRGVKYPMLYVSARDVQIEVCDGGRQILRRVECVVEAHTSRERGESGQNGLLAKAAAGVIPYFSVCGRRFVPEDLKMGIEDGRALLKFEIGFCDLPPERVVEVNRDMMGEILFEF